MFSSPSCTADFIFRQDKGYFFWIFFVCLFCFWVLLFFFLSCEPWFAEWLLGGQTSAVFLRPCTYVPSVRGNGRRADYRPVVDLQCAVEGKATCPGIKLQLRSWPDCDCRVWTQCLLVVEGRRCNKQSGTCYWCVKFYIQSAKIMSANSITQTQWKCINISFVIRASTHTDSWRGQRKFGLMLWCLNKCGILLVNNYLIAEVS